MSLKPWKKISEEVVVTNPWWEYRLYHYELPNGTKVDYHVPFTTGFSAVVPIREDGKILMLKMYRPLVSTVTIEFPAGNREDDESYEQAARREFLEETDLEAGKLELAGTAFGSAGFTNQEFHTFIATDLKETAGEKDPTEEFEEMWLTVEEIDGMVASQDINVGDVVTIWTQARARVREIVDQLKNS